MGYTTEFNGHINVEPALNAEEIKFIQDHNKTRRMLRKNGPYYISTAGDYGQVREDDIIEYNAAPEKQLSLWCGWTCTDDGTAIEWDGGEKFYSAAEWMKWLIEHILGTEPLAKSVLPFLQGHTLSGEIFAQGEEMDDRWKLIVDSNTVMVAKSLAAYSEPEEI